MPPSGNQETRPESAALVGTLGQVSQIGDACVESDMFEAEPPVPPPKWRVMISCEHGGNDVPTTYAALFEARQELLDSHRGYDIGAMTMGRALAAALCAPFYVATVTRLLVDLNRSEHHPRLHSPFVSALPSSTRTAIIAQYYRPYREQVEHYVAHQIDDGFRILHLSSHSFTPNLDGQQRRADIGLLYDPQRNAEQQFAIRWQTSLRSLQPALRVRRNYPYRGAADGFTTYLRRRFPPDRYLGLELELNQRWPAGPEQAWFDLQQTVAKSLNQELNRIDVTVDVRGSDGR